MTELVLSIGSSWQMYDLTFVVDKGLSCFRLNAGRLSAEEMQVWAARLDSLKQKGYDVDLFLDLPGRKCRVWGEFINTIPGSKLTISLSDKRSIGVRLSACGLYPSPEVGDIIKVRRRSSIVRLEVVEATNTFMTVVALDKGRVGGGYQVAVTNRYEPSQQLTFGDHLALNLVPDLQPSFVCASFSDSPSIPIMTRQKLSAIKQFPKLLSKVETKIGISALGLIAKESDGIVIGRDDLLMWFSHEEVDELTLEIIEKYIGSDKVIIPGSNYFTSLDKGLTSLSQGEAYFLKATLDLCPPFLYCNETTKANILPLVVENWKKYGSSKN
ncbi:MAG: hypothetical protein F4W92_10885 [Gammaproteobacteria bacterium]|nr:hypothetical protein [Gammaproteobacteria bacterium]